MAKPRTPIDYFDSKTLREGLKQKTVRGGAITAVGQLASVAISLASVPVLSRLLDPKDFGLIAMVAVLTNFARMFVDAGLSMADRPTRNNNASTSEQSLLDCYQLGCSHCPGSRLPVAGRCLVLQRTPACSYHTRSCDLFCVERASLYSIRHFCIAACNSPP